MGTVITTVDFGNHVACDFCSEEHSADKTALGGLLLDTYALCPKCVAGAGNELKPSQIKARAADMETFHAFVIRIRAGNNTMTITSK